MGAAPLGTAAPARLEVHGLRRAFGSVAALDGVTLAAEPGELLTILGPSGSGKTTLLRTVAGYEAPDAGQVLLAGEDVTALPPARRNIGMVFQNYALFPHMTVGANVAFPLEMRRRPRTEVRARVADALRLVELPGYEGRLPAQLSGGQQQRVALARAVVFEPRLLLLDEPFGALDRKLREAMQLEVRRLQRRLGITTVFITHDQEEALVLSDRIATMNRGRVEQVGTPAEIYDAPGSVFVADFVGESNLFRGTVQPGPGEGGTVQVRLDDGESGPVLLAMPAGSSSRPAGGGGAGVRILIRPERIVLAPSGAATVPMNALQGTVEETVFVGTAHKLRLRLAGRQELLVRLPAAGGLPPPPGTPVTAYVAAADVRLLPSGEDRGAPDGAA